MINAVELREYTADDRQEVLAFLRDALGESAGVRTEALFRWKHEQSPFGPSIAWMGFDGRKLVGFRAMMRWEFTRAGEMIHAARGVDTATAASHRGRGVFRTLTLYGLDHLRTEGTEFIFNTPNSMSRPGFIKMGWDVVGRLPVRVRPAGAGAFVRMARAKVPADLWSVPTTVGLSIDEWSASARALLVDVASKRRASPQLRTAISRDYLCWRYGFEPLSYRVWPVGTTPDDGAIVFRLRRRGPVLEAAILDVLARETVRGRHLHQLLRATRADYALTLNQSVIGGTVRLPKQGPVLTTRAVVGASPARAERWSLALGDVELF